MAHAIIERTGEQAMSRTVSEWIGATPDSAIPDRVKVRVFGRDNGRCKGCTRKCGVGGEPWQIDHKIALANGGQHRESNLRLLCVECHKEKTKEDVAEKSHVYKRRRRHVGVKKDRTIRAWRKFDGTPVYASRVRT